MKLRSIAFLAVPFALVFASVLQAETISFRRGDVNRNGWPDISDAYLILAWTYLGGDPPQCLEAADANDDGDVNALDAAYILAWLQGEGPPVPDDPSPEGLACGRYESVSLAKDKTCILRPIGGTAPGGDDSKVVLRLAVTNAEAISPLYRGDLMDFDGVLQGIADVRFLVGPPGPPFFKSLGGGGIDHIDYIFALMGDVAGGAAPIPPSEDLEFIELTLCLKKGVPPGSYRFIFRGELMAYPTGKVFTPAFIDWPETDCRVVVENTITGADSCDDAPEEKLANIAFSFGNASARPGDQVEVPMKIRSDMPVFAYAFSVDFDEEVLEPVSVRPSWKRADGLEYDDFRYHANPLDESPGSAGIDEGYLVGNVLHDISCESMMPPDVDHEALIFRFRVKPGATAGATEVRFLDWARFPIVRDGEVIWGDNASVDRARNQVMVATPQGQGCRHLQVYPETAGSFVFLDGRVTVLPDISIFVRADSNGDSGIDVSDPLFTLGYLFLGGEAPPCLDAADANDDGRIDVADPITTLGFLFLEGLALPAPYGSPGTDPTDDGLDCHYRR